MPVTGATVQLYAVGSTGDGSPATPLLSPASTTDANGNFNITGTYLCPSSSALVYIVATGGNPGLGSGINNSSISLMATLGACGNLSATTFININEVTTVAAAYALTPFATSASAIGSSPADAAIFSAAFSLSGDFANATLGSSPGVNVPAGTTVPFAEINTLADLLASCVNSSGGSSGDGSSCGNLFSLTTPTGSLAPTIHSPPSYNSRPVPPSTPPLFSI